MLLLLSVSLEQSSSCEHFKSCLLFLVVLGFVHDGNVAMITLPMPWYIPRNNAGLGVPVA
jgi:hypothetical protein